MRKGPMKSPNKAHLDWQFHGNTPQPEENRVPSFI